MSDSNYTTSQLSEEEKELLEEVRQEYEHLFAECEAKLLDAIAFGEWSELQTWIRKTKALFPHPALATECCCSARAEEMGTNFNDLFFVEGEGV